MPSIDRFIQGGFMLYPRGTFGTNFYLFNKVIGNVPDTTFKDNYNKTTLRTFGKFPAIFYVGNTNYKTFSLQTVFTSDQNAYEYTASDLSAKDSIASRYPEWRLNMPYRGPSPGPASIVKVWNILANRFDFYRCNGSHTSSVNNAPPVSSGSTGFWSLIIPSPSDSVTITIGDNDDIITITAYDQYIGFKRQIDQRIPWVIRGSISGEDFICDLEITSTMHNQNSIIHKGGNVESQRLGCEDIFFSDYIQVTIECTEVDDYIYPDPYNGITGDGPEDRFDIWGES